MPATSQAATLADWGEQRFLRWVRRMAGTNLRPGEAGLALSIGDDAAHLKLGRGGDPIVTTDALIEGVHFRRDWIGPRDLGAKSMTTNLSDLAAMGAWPVAVFLTLGVPSTTSISELKAFFRGLRDEGRKWTCPLAGGDLVKAPQWMINLALIGRPEPGRRVILRSDARPGQTLYVTGWPGESAAGLEALRRGDREPALIRRHNGPTPRLREAAAIKPKCRRLAMIDVSDGIVNDAGHLARESGVAIEILADALPLSRTLRRYARRIGHDPLDWALFGGEDYELLFTTRRRRDTIEAVLRSAGLKTPVAAIGRVRAGKGVHLVDREGNAIHFKDRTFRHFS